MGTRLLTAFGVLLTFVVGGVVTAPGAAADGPGCARSKYERHAVVRFSPGPSEFSLTIDNRGNPEVQTETWEVSAERTETKSNKVSGEVSTSIKTGLKFLAEGKVDVKLGAERSTQESVTVKVTRRSERKYPANTWGTWTKGVYTVTATAIHRCWKSRQQEWVVAGKARRTWPVTEAWKWTLIKKG